MEAQISQSEEKFLSNVAHNDEEDASVRIQSPIAIPTLSSSELTP
jgi:hypothetical protein